MCTIMLSLLLGLIAFHNTSAQTNSGCNPTTTTCTPNPGLNSASYYVDFTASNKLPANWTIANYETVNFGTQGAEFTFKKRNDAPYMWTDWYMLFGRIDIVAKAAPGTAIISSSVLLSDDLDEIDWEWSGNNFGTSAGRVQTNYFGKGVTGTYDRGTQPAVSNPQTVFHTYSIDWSPTQLTWLIDGVNVRTLSASNADTTNHQYPQSPAKLHLGLWDAGDASVSSGTVQWAGGLTDLTKAPFTYYVKSVKITNTNPADWYQWTDKSGKWTSIHEIKGPLPQSLNTSYTPTSAAVRSISTSIGKASLSSSVMSKLSNSMSSTGSLTSIIPVSLSSSMAKPGSLTSIVPVSKPSSMSSKISGLSTTSAVPSVFSSLSSKISSNLASIHAVMTSKASVASASSKPIDSCAPYVFVSGKPPWPYYVYPCQKTTSRYSGSIGKLGASATAHVSYSMPSSAPMPSSLAGHSTTTTR